MSDRELPVMGAIPVWLQKVSNCNIMANIDCKYNLL